MNDQTYEPPGPQGAPDPGPAPSTGPRVSGEQVRDFSRLRRSRSDRYVGGVAGGLGRHLDVDPTVVRVVLAVLALFGGAGLLVYAALWLLVPSDGEDRAPLGLGPEVAKVVVLIAVVVAATFVLGVPWWGGSGVWFSWPLVLVVLLGVWLVTRSRDSGQAPPPPPYAQTAPYAAAGPPTPVDPAPAAPDTWESTTEARDGWATTPLPADHTPPPPPPGAAPVWGPPPPPLPPRPRRTGTVLFWPTLAVIAVALGALGVLDVSADVPISAYAALALAITGAALLFGAFRARPGGLIALGLVLVLALGATSVADAVGAFGPYGQTTTTPRSAAELPTGTFEPPSGEATLDLTEVDDPADLDGRTVRANLDVGRLTVILPPGVSADVVGELRWAGEVLVDGQSTGGGSGFDTSGTVGTPGTGPTISLDLEVGVGQIDVYRSPQVVTVP